MLKDLQNEKDYRNIFISNIGICDYKLPISIQIGENETINILEQIIILCWEGLAYVP